MSFSSGHSVTITAAFAGAATAERVGVLDAARKRAVVGDRIPATHLGAFRATATPHDRRRLRMSSVFGLRRDRAARPSCRSASRMALEFPATRFFGARPTRSPPKAGSVTRELEASCLSASGPWENDGLNYEAGGRPERRTTSAADAPQDNRLEPRSARSGLLATRDSTVCATESVGTHVDAGRTSEAYRSVITPTGYHADAQRGGTGRG
jgi:hypothetical protein